MPFIRSKKSLLLYQSILSLVAISVCLVLILQPKEGWTAWVSRTLRSTHSTVATPAVPTNIQVQHNLKYDLDAELDTANSVVRGTVAVSVPEAPDTQLLFYLYPSTYKPIQIEQVEADGQKVSFQADSQHLTVPLPQKGEAVEVTIRFSTPIPAAGTRLGQKDGVWSLTYWYPILGVRANNTWLPRPQPRPFGDPFLMDLAAYHVKLKHPTGFQWFASGYPLSSQTEAGVTISEWRSESLRSFALVGGTGWTETMWKTADGVDVKIATRTPKTLPELQRITQTAVKTYTKRFGSLAYPSFAVVEMPAGTVFAHEYPNLALFSQEIWSWGTGEHWIAHEIAHAWWFSSVGTYKALGPWLDEGLADYAALLYIEAQYGHAAYKETIAQNWNLFRGEKSYSPHNYQAPVQVKEQAADQPYANFASETDYYYLMYLRPQLMYHDLRMELGDEQFFRFLQQFYLKNRYATTTRDRLEEALRQVKPEAVSRMKMWLDSPNGDLIQSVKDRFA
ncbi:M1 family aminopeptidase [Effusibacillus lacus]|uniref:Peptidase M1 membrane alanine aminopeptidase domain-containing protein n=1 Tax=Effusibacillus lacus TaxID=1348429 RepID=A0A292YNU1_9BACL|nr:M1 family aminopeptidase [Effusibacillus lacus]TCS66901.1 hypothetical protein EDD64_1533 [Effusibacillus lacus]GAX90856.1 hypothetical protein EFBL_2498 [Effusibacillus lacus]